MLKDFLKSEIEAHGPMSMADYMAHVLGHPEYGYYMTRDPFGEAGDFTTAPEISQIFGEMVGVWVAQIWMQMGQPERFCLLECGPGRGTLMADLLRAVSKVDGLLDAAQVTLLEMSPVLREKQREALAGHDVQWVDDLADVPDDVPVIVVANEFLDALPVHQLQYIGNQWVERFVGCDGSGHFRVTEGVADEALLALIPAAVGDASEGDIVEVSPQRLDFVRGLADKMTRCGGAGLFIDYGHGQSSAGDTLQAVYRHDFVGVLDHIGEADVTAHVDFGVLVEMLESMGCMPVSLLMQEQFLRRLGGDLRCQALAEAARDEVQAESIVEAYERLVRNGANQMGELFKVLSFYRGAS